MEPLVDSNAETDTLLALSVLEGGSSGAVASLADEQPGFVSQLQDVHKIMSTLGALRGADGVSAPPPVPSWGPFSLKEQIGRGSFGVVCRAFDPAVAREIAVKLYAGETLPPEPRLMARVRHPNVVTVFGAAVHEGRPGIWMELVHGRTLAERVQAQGPLPVDEVLRIAVELCGAVEAVHGAHLVHGDIKPRNVMEQDDGRVVLMDFGAGSARARVDGPVRSVSGTPLYMAPEVVLGGAPSAQSDLYSLGVLIYYALTGTYPTYAADWKDLRALHARGQDRPSLRRTEAMLRELRPDVPRGLARCLARATAPAERRYRTAAELRAALEGVRRARVRTWPLAGVAQWRLPVGVIVALALALGAAAGLWLAPSPKAPPKVVLRRLTWEKRFSADPTRSPDGKLLAYASERGGAHLDIWVQQVAGGVPLRLTDHPSDDWQPAFSPDGSKIAFRSERDGGGIYVVPTFGGEARLIARGARMPRFSPDGRWISYFGRSASSLYLAPAGGGPVQELSAVIPMITNAAVWSPDGGHLLFLCYVGATGPDWCVVRVGPKGQEGPIVPTGAFPALRSRELDTVTTLPTPWDWIGSSIYFSARLGDTTNIWKVGIDPRTFAVAGPPERMSVSTQDQYQPSMGADGTLVFATRTSVPYVWELPLDTEAGRARGTPRPVMRYDDTTHGIHSVSPDGRWLAFTSARLGHRAIWVKDLKTGAERPLAVGSGGATERYPVFNARGTALLYEATKENVRSVHAISVDGGIPDLVCRDCGPATDWSADGRYIIMQNGVPSPSAVLLDRTTGQRVDILRHGEREIYRTHFSPDGRWLAFHAALPHGPTREYVAPFRGMAPIPEAEWIAVTDGDALTDAARWSPDGNLLYYVSDVDGFLCVWARRLDPATKRPLGEAFAVQHFHARENSLDVLDVRNMELSMTRGRLLFNWVEFEGDIWMAEFR